VIDGACPGDHWRESFSSWASGGASACVVSVAAWESCRETTDLIGDVLRLVRRREELCRKVYPPPPWHYPGGLEDASGLPNLTRRLLQRGFGEPDVRGIIGENWLRVFDAVWSSSS